LIHLYNFFPGINDIEVNHRKGKYFLYFGGLSQEKGLYTLLNWVLSMEDAEEKLMPGEKKITASDQPVP
jgi:hypothetical protein